jgi:hypothetical protein
MKVRVVPAEEIAEHPNLSLNARDYVEDFDQDEVMCPLPCAACGGMLVYMGNLGDRLHYRCRNCGLDQSRERERKE